MVQMGVRLRYYVKLQERYIRGCIISELVDFL
jgi:hypothetical protein